ncbi:hypothetical protein [Cellulomonas fengjieae]|uniref:hypothetical protein n=1 Tax=Cellulomonas fengjieae TaxID=2819978 RepID=UPI001AAF3BE1|nr:hypothetical protein [Cellulomonas fengjieae]MBO3103566.1 hypothetical protein [Cellulomonas fengjieae]
MSAAGTAPGWWRRNRWALVALPAALVLALAASGDRVRTMWWQQDLRRPATAEGGESIQFRQRVLDGVGGTMPVDVQVRLDGVDDAPVLPDDMTLPAGTRAVQVDLTLSADPDVVLTGCSLAVRDATGTRYVYEWNSGGALQAVVPCVPEDTPGPRPSLGDLDDVLSEQSTPPRPETWSVSPVVVVPDDVEIADVVLWWQMPQYVLLEVPGRQG